VTVDRELSRMLLLTYDYELFFRRSGTVERCLLEPTEQILEVGRRHGGMASTFFVDTMHLLRCRGGNQSVRDDFERMAEQLRRVVAQGHRVELHLHPHWLDAVHEGSGWRFPSYDRYRLHALPQSEIESLFIAGTQILEEIVSEVDPAYRVRAFRAGGWCIQPSRPIVSAMRKAGIHIDSSVGPGCSAAGRSHFFDFRGVHIDRPYCFNSDVTNQSDSGSQYEVPISTLNLVFLDRLARRLEVLLAKPENQPFGDGRGMQVAEGSVTTVGRLQRRLRGETTFLTLDNMSFYTIRRAMKRAGDYLCFISHPKLMSGHSLRLLESLAQDSRNHFLTVAGAADRSWSEC